MSTGRTHGIDVAIAADRLTATVTIAGNLDRKRVTVAALTGAVKDAGVHIDDDVKQRIEQTVHRASVVEGPVEGVVADVRARNSGIEWTPGGDPTAVRRAVTEEENKDADVDHYDRSIYVKVTSGDRVASIRTPGERIDVTGAPLDADAPPALTLDDCTLRRDGNAVLASLDGVLWIEGGTVFVSRRLEVKQSVDFSVGNIDFAGAVHVHGDVKGRFLVAAGEDLVIDGLIESATIKAGRSLECGRGMSARDRGSLDVGDNARIGFLNSVRGTIGGSLTVRGEVMNCELDIRGDLECAAGAVIGGEVTASGRVEVGAIGSPRVIPTTLKVGIRDQTKDLERVNELLDRLRAEMKRKSNHCRMMQASLGSMTEAQKRDLKDLALEVREDGKRLTELEARRDRTAAASEKAAGSIEVHVHKCIHPGSVIIIRGTAWSFERELEGPVRIQLNEAGEGVFRYGTGAARPLSEVTTVHAEAA